MKEFILTLNESEIILIGNALGKMPFNEVRSVIEKIESQCNEQLLNQMTDQQPQGQEPGEIEQGKTIPLKPKDQ